ncbi:MAG: hypothetical protein M3R25_14925 [Bacteroidota bacterium]|nr:hypothetical protein [Bacteroidota bacterium]
MKYSAIYMICLGLVFFGCGKPVSQEDLIQTAIEIRLKQWKEEQIVLCREKAITNATEYVDSMMIVNSLDTKLDTIPKPPKPNKPSKPIFKSTPDSLKVEELKKGK